jgi:hypothetical protein
MRFVPNKTAEQQGQLTVHRLREGFKEEGFLRTLEGGGIGVLTSCLRL